MKDVRAILMVPVLAWCALAQESRPGEAVPTAVYTLADHHTSRWTNERDPLVKVAGVCRMVPGGALFTLACSAPPVSEPRTGRRHYYSVVLFRDLEENLYLAACAATSRNTRCDDLRAGQTFSAEVEDQTIKIVARGEQLAMRIFETRPRPTTIDSPTQGTPSQVKPSPGTPSAVTHSRVSVTRGTPSAVLPSDVSIAAGSPSLAPPSQVSNPVVSPTGGRLYLHCSNGSARVYVDGHLIGPPPVDVPLVPGRHTVVVKASGFADWVRRIETAGGSVTRLTAELGR